MPRAARLHYPGGVFHLISRCPAGRFLIRGDDERSYYLNLMGRVLGHTDAEVLAWCVMSSHTHLVVVQGADPLERLVKPLNTGLAAFINRLRRGKGAKGPVFAQRPRAVLVDSDAYLLELVRYVHNNPVRAGVAKTASDCSWSSHRAYVGLDPAPDWLNVGFVLERFGKHRKRARQAFDQFIRETQSAAREAQFSGDRQRAAHEQVARAVGDGWRATDGILGDEQFVARVRRDLKKMQKTFSGGRLATNNEERSEDWPRPRDVIDAVLAQLDISPWDFETRPKARKNVLARRLMVWVWARRFGGKQIGLARELQTGTAAVSRWLGAATEVTADLEPLADAVVLQLTSTKRNKGEKRPPATGVQYNVVVEE